jgi:ribokinase
MSVVVVGSANLDLVYRTPRIPSPGETVLATGFQSNPGGKGNNQVTAVARAGAEVSFIAALGQDAAAAEISESLDAAGVTQLVRQLGSPTGTALITVDDQAENTIVVNSGANAELVDLTAAECAAIEASDYLLMQLESPLATVAHAAEVGRNAGTTVILNAAPVRELPESIWHNIDLLIVNEHEAEELSGESDERRAATALTKLGPAVIVTLGSEGALVCVADAPAVVVPGIRVSAVDTTGAGDTFCGALVAALDAGGRGLTLDSLVDAAGFATAAAALSVQEVGAIPSIPTLDRIRAFIAQQ